MRRSRGPDAERGRQPGRHPHGHGRRPNNCRGGDSCRHADDGAHPQGSQPIARTSRGEAREEHENEAWNGGGRQHASTEGVRADGETGDQGAPVGRTRRKWVVATPDRQDEAPGAPSRRPGGSATSQPGQCRGRERTSASGQALRVASRTRSCARAPVSPPRSRAVDLKAYWSGRAKGRVEVGRAPAFPLTDRRRRLSAAGRSRRTGWIASTTSPVPRELQPASSGPSRGRTRRSGCRRRSTQHREHPPRWPPRSACCCPPSELELRPSWILLCRRREAAMPGRSRKAVIRGSRCRPRTRRCRGSRG